MERVFNTIPSVISTTASDESTAEALVFAAWREIAGETLSRRARAIALVRKRLTVAVNDAVWQRNLEDLAPGFIARLNRITGDRTVTFIDFVVDSKPFNDALKAASKDDNDLDLSASLIEAADAINDEELRKNFLATANDYLARQTAR